jgi:hypothetical protein
MAANTIVTITYSVPGGKRREFDSLIRALEGRINGSQQAVRFSVYQSEDTPGTYVELYECDTTAAYDALEDSLDDETSQHISRIATDFAEARQAVMTLRKM